MDLRYIIRKENGECGSPAPALPSLHRWGPWSEEKKYMSIYMCQYISGGDKMASVFQIFISSQGCSQLGDPLLLWYWQLQFEGNTWLGEIGGVYKPRDLAPNGHHGVWKKLDFSLSIRKRETSAKLWFHLVSCPDQSGHWSGRGMVRCGELNCSSPIR